MQSKSRTVFTINPIIDPSKRHHCFRYCLPHAPAPLLITLNLRDESVSPNKFSSPSPLHYPDPLVSLVWVRVKYGHRTNTNVSICCAAHLHYSQLRKLNIAFISRLNPTRSNTGIKHGNNFLFKSQSVFDHRIGITAKCTVLMEFAIGNSDKHKLRQRKILSVSQLQTWIYMILIIIFLSNVKFFEKFFCWKSV